MRIPRKLLCLALSVVLLSSSLPPAALAWRDDDRLSYNPNQNRDYGSTYRFQDQQSRFNYQPQTQLSLPRQLDLPVFTFSGVSFASTLPRQETWRAPAFSFTAATPDFSALSNNRPAPDLSRVQDFSRPAEQTLNASSPRADAFDTTRPDTPDSPGLPLVSQPAAELARMSSSLLPGAMALDAARSVLSRPAAPEPQPLRLDDLDLPVSYTRSPAPAPIQALSVPVLLHNAHQALVRFATAASDAVHLRRQVPAADLPDGSRLRGNITLNRDGSLQRVAPGTLRTVGSAPITVAGETWKYGEFQYQGNAWNLKGPGTQLVPELKGYDLKGQPVERRQFGDGQGNRVPQGYGPAQGGDGKITDLSTGLSAQYSANAWRFTPGQTGKLVLEGQVLNLKIDEKGKLSAPARVTLSQGTFQVQGVAPHLGTGGVELLAKVDLAPGEALKVQGLSGKEPGYQGPPEEPLLRQAVALPGDRVPVATIKIRQEGNSCLIQGQAAVALVTAPATPQSQTLAHITALLPEYSQLTVTGKTSFPQGITIHTGPAKVGTFGNKIEPQSGAIYQTPEDQTPRLYQKRLTSDAAVQNLDMAAGTFLAVMGHDSGGLDTQEWIFITKLEVPGVIDKDTGQARLVDGKYQAQARMHFNHGEDESLHGEYEGRLGILVKDSEVFIRDLGSNADPKKEDNGWKLKSESTFKPGLPMTSLTEAAAKTATRGLRDDTSSRLKETAIAVLASPATGIEKRAKALWDAAGSRVGKAIDALREERALRAAALKPAPFKTTPEAATALVKTLTPAPAGEALRKSYDWTVERTKSAASNTKTYVLNLAQDTQVVAEFGFEYGLEKTKAGAEIMRDHARPVAEGYGPNVTATWSEMRRQDPVAVQKLAFGLVAGYFSRDIFDGPARITFEEVGPAVVTINGVRTSFDGAKDMNDSVNKSVGIGRSTIVRNDTHGTFGVRDFLQVLSHEYLGAVDAPAVQAAMAIREGIRQKGEVFVVAHSQGSAVFRAALRLISVEERSKIHYLGLGAENYISKEAFGLADTKNVWNQGDAVPASGNIFRLSGWLNPGEWSRKINATWTRINTPQGGALEHGFVEHYAEEVTIWWREREGKK